METTTTTTFRQELISQAQNWLVCQGYKVTGPDRLVDRANCPVDLTHVDRLYRLDTAMSNGRGVTKELRSDAMAVALTLLEQSNIANIAATIAYDEIVTEKGLEELYRWLKAVTARPDAELAVPIKVMQHFLWQVKRKLIGKPVDYHLMPLLYGQVQGSGKSKAIRALLAPLHRYALNSKTVPEIIDSRNFRTLSTHYVCFLDEMGKSELADIETLKNILSADTINYRPLFTNASATVLQNSTFIGASNREIKTLIKDNTGMRRFYEITCLPEAKNQKAWDTVNNLDVMAIWKSVDESQDVPEIREWLSDLTTHQEELRTKNSIEEYLTEFDVKKGAERIPLKNLYTKYHDFCREGGIDGIFSRPNFTNEMKTRGFVMGRADYGSYFLLDKAPTQVQNVTKTKGAIA